MPWTTYAYQKYNCGWMPRSDAIRGIETVNKPLLVLVSKVMAVNCRMMMVARLLRTSGRVG